MHCPYLRFKKEKERRKELESRQREAEVQRPRGSKACGKSHRRACGSASKERGGSCALPARGELGTVSPVTWASLGTWKLQRDLLRSESEILSQNHRFVECHGQKGMQRSPVCPPSPSLPHLQGQGALEAFLSTKPFHTHNPPTPTTLTREARPILTFPLTREFTEA